LLKLKCRKNENVDLVSLALELAKEGKVEALINAKVTGLSGVEHIINILIKKPCNVAIILPGLNKEIGAEVIKTVVMSLDTRLPIIFLVRKNKSKNVIFELIKEYPISIITYENKNDLLSKIKSAIFDLCSNEAN